MLNNIKIILIPLLLILICSFWISTFSNNSYEINIQIIDTSKNNVNTRYLPPTGYYRDSVTKGSFAYYLRNLPLKKYSELVHYYNGSIKENTNIYCGVLTFDVGNKDLMQCADGVIRLRAEYLYSLEKYSEINFKLTNGFLCEYLKWRKGYRVNVVGNKTSWVKKHQSSESYSEFRKYLDFVFTYAGTLSLSKELISTNIDSIEAGNVFIVGGSPGHAVIILDVIKNKNTNERLFLLAQSYMPAQEIQILNNNNTIDLSPWYSNVSTTTISTPQWTFEKSDLKKFIK